MAWRVTKLVEQTGKDTLDRLEGAPGGRRACVGESIHNANCIALCIQRKKEWGEK